jgi:metal-responsive CopG/Arc/MetJ family transcriptional regulator
MSYVGINIPEALTDQIDEIIEKGKQGYTSRAEFIKDASRQLIYKIKQNGGNGNGGNTSHLSTTKTKNNEKKERKNNV